VFKEELSNLMLKARNAYGCFGDYEKQRDVTERGLRMQEQLYGPLSDLYQHVQLQHERQ